MKRKLLGAAAVIGAVLVLIAVTPIGPAALAYLLERGVGEWKISIGGRRGGLLYAFSFSDVRCKNPALGVTVNAEYIAVWPWSWEVDIQAPKVRIEPSTGRYDRRGRGYRATPRLFTQPQLRPPVRSIGNRAKRGSWRRIGTPRFEQ